MITDTQIKIRDLFTNFQDFLIEKNKNYGDSALNPVEIFTKIEPDNPLCVRLDDKLSRIRNSSELRKNDVSDIFGYIALLLLQKGWTTFKEMVD